MVRMRFYQSVVFRLVLCLLMGGAVISLGLGILELRRAEAMLGMEITQRAMITTRNIQSVLRGVMRQGNQRAVQDVLSVYLDGRVRAVRVATAGQPAISLGDWPADSGHISLWQLSEHGITAGHEVAIDRLTLMRAPFSDGQSVILLELLIDGPAARQHLKAKLVNQMGLQMLLLAMVILMGLLLVRRWFTGPLSDISQLVAQHAGPEPFFRLSSQVSGEFGQLAQAVGGMLSRLDAANAQLRRRERAFENLYQYAPAAMVSLDEQGRIIEANRRAASLLQFECEKALLGRLVLDFIRPEDRGVFRQNIDRLSIDDASRCHLRLSVQGQELDVMVESTAVRDEEGVMQSVRLSMLDVSESSRLHRQLADKSQLLNLVVDHMSDAMLLVDAQGRVAAYNEPMALLLDQRPGVLVGRPYDPETFWDRLGVQDPESFILKLRKIEAENDRPAQERFVSRAGSFQIQGIPVRDSLDHLVGRLWVARDISSQEQSEQLFAQQARQLQALKDMGQQLGGTTGLDSLLDQMASRLHEVFGVETVGLALRHGDGSMRSRQILHRGGSNCLIETSEALMQAAEQHLMPSILGNRDIILWSELPQGESWSKAFKAANLTTLAGCPLLANGQTQGILWIARRGGERIDRHHIYLMEALAPLISARIEIARLYDYMHDLELTDTITNLPNASQFEQQLSRLERRPGVAWSIVLLKIDHFRRLNELLDHDAANSLLRDIGSLLQNTARKDCEVFRIRGPVFGLICDGYSREQTLRLAERLRQTLAGHHVPITAGGRWSITTSIGVVSCPDDGLHVHDLYDLAMSRLETARRTGRDCIISTGRPEDRQAG